MIPDGRFFERAVARIWKIMLVLGSGGTAAALAWGGWKSGEGFLLGAAASWLNFVCLKAIVNALGVGANGPADAPPVQQTRKHTLTLAVLRYVLLGLGAYAIVIYSTISILAALVGLFVATAAVIVEILFELVYANRVVDHQDLQ